MSVYTVPRGKNISNSVREVNVPAHQPQKGSKIISKEFGV